MSEAKSKDTPADEASTEATKAKGKQEKERNDSALRQKAEEKQAEQEAHEADPDQPEGQPPPDPDQLRGEIAETREGLGDTVEALAAKADVKGQAKEKAEQQKARAQAKIDQTAGQVKENPTPVAAIAGGALAALLLVLFLKRRNS